MALPTGKEILYRCTPTLRDHELIHHLADEYVVYRDRSVASGIASYERRGDKWASACSLRTVLAHALNDLLKARGIGEK